MRCKILYLVLLLQFTQRLAAEDGYDLWLRYQQVNNTNLLRIYNTVITGIFMTDQSPTLVAVREELMSGLSSLLGNKVSHHTAIQRGSLLVGTASQLPATLAQAIRRELAETGNEGFLILSTTYQSLPITLISANTDAGVLYGSFHFLRLLQTQQPIQSLRIVSAPKLQLRVLNHWDNLDRSVERGYAGISIWDWHKLPLYLDPRYKDYARANASIGINGAVLTNVNANALALTIPYLQKVAALADVFRPYHIKVYLTARFSAPVEIGGLTTADPLDPAVQQWWKDKAAAIYQLVPNFGGFLVKANSEGQPGPQHYGRSHADGANLLADALAPYGGNVIWRAFVYSHESPEDRFKQACQEFKPLDGSFRKNVLVQVKNGPIDFQPREPFHPLFGAMPKTPLMMEFQLTQEYMGFATHLVYLASLFKEVLEADTYARGKGSTVARIIDGSVHGYPLTGMAGVSNIGNEQNWTGHPFAQANWYALGRLAWDHSLTAAGIADEWVRQTLSNDPAAIAPVKQIMLTSHEAVVNYMTPLGLHHIMGEGHHYGPAPWFNQAPRPDWNSVYYHRADKTGLGFNRTASGSNALAQYAPEVRARWASPDQCPLPWLLWFHHIGWQQRLSSGKTLWETLCDYYYAGVDSVHSMRAQWQRVQPFIDPQQFHQVAQLLRIQEQEAIWWRNACLLYFQTFSNMPIPTSYEQPNQTLQYYQSLRFPFAPGI